MVQCESRRAPLGLCLGDRPPAAVDEIRRIAGNIVEVAFEVLGPEALPCGAGQVAVVGDDARLGVVEKRMVVQVGGADDQSRVVDDRELGVHIDRVGDRPERAFRQQASTRPAPSSASTSSASAPRVSSPPPLASPEARARSGNGRRAGVAASRPATGRPRATTGTATRDTPGGVRRAFERHSRIPNDPRRYWG